MVAHKLYFQIHNRLKESVLQTVVRKKLKAEDNIGKIYGPAGQLKIVGIRNRHGEGGKKTMFNVHCSICATDPELFGDGVFASALGNLNKGALPCGCGRNPRWDEDQILVKVRRNLKDSTCEVLGYAEPYHGNETKLSLRCKVHGTEWTHTTVHTGTAPSYSGMCIECEKDLIANRHAQHEDAHADEILSSGKFAPGTKLWRIRSRNGTSQATWGMLCGKCSYDEFVENNLCIGVFETSLQSLKDGHRPCRCSNKYRYSHSQRRYQIEKVIKSTDAKWVFTGFVKGTFDRHIRLNGYCDVHGEFEQSVSHIVKNSSGCPRCASYGFNKAKTGYVYVLDIEGVIGCFTGYGISNNVKNRFTDHRRNLSYAGFKIVNQKVFECDGKLAAQVELELKKEFPINGQEVCGFKTEATHHHRYNEVVEYVSRRIS
jgi:hypothetical protein